MKQSLETKLAVAGAVSGINTAKAIKATGSFFKNASAYVVALGKTIGLGTVDSLKAVSVTAKHQFEVAKAKQR